MKRPFVFDGVLFYFFVVGSVFRGVSKLRGGEAQKELHRLAEGAPKVSERPSATVELRGAFWSRSRRQRDCGVQRVLVFFSFEGFGWGLLATFLQGWGSCVRPLLGLRI